MTHNKGKLILRLAALIGLLALGLLPSLGVAAPQEPKMYWTERGMDFALNLANDDGYGRIQRANADGTELQELVTKLNQPMGIALDITAGKMYWTEVGTPPAPVKAANGDGNSKIQRANLDGTGVEELVSGLNGPVGIALDVAAGKMYWTEAGTATTTKSTSTDGDGKIQRANLDGTEIEELASGLIQPFGIALDTGAGKMYWTELVGAAPGKAVAFDGTGKIKRANMVDGSEIVVLADGLVWPRDIALDVAGGKMYTTHGGAFALKSTNSTLGDIQVNNQDGIGGYIRVTNLDGTEGQILITDLNSPSGIDLDLIGGKIYWTGRPTPNGLSLANYDGIGQIQRANLDGTGAEVLITGLAEPRGIALHFAKTLTVNKAGAGAVTKTQAEGWTGTVTSDPAGINCGTECTANYPENAVVTLTAHPGFKSYFVGWSDDCTGTDLTVQVTMDADKTCTATFGYPVGGIVVPVDKLGLVAPWMGLVGLVAVAALGVVVVRRRRN